MSRFSASARKSAGLIGSTHFLLPAEAGAAADGSFSPDVFALCLATLPATEPNQIWTSWSLSPAITLPLLVISALYCLGARTSRTNAFPSRFQRYCFAAAIGCLVIALISPLCRMAASLAWAHMVQHVLLVVGAPLLLVLSNPSDTLLNGLSGSLRKRMKVSGQYRAAVRPHLWLLIGFVLYGASIWFWHIPAAYQGALLNTGVHLIMYANLLVVSILFWHWIFETHRISDAASGLAAMLLFFTFLHTALLGLLLALSPQVWYPLMAGGKAWNLSPLDDQRLSGLIMWIPMGGVYFVAALALLSKLLRGSEGISRTDAKSA